MLHISLLLAWRYLQSSSTNSIKTMLWISLFTIALASYSLALVIFIMTGFEKSTHETLKGMHADIIMKVQNQHINFPSVKKVLEQEFSEILVCSPSDIQQGLIRTHSTDPTAILIKIIDPVYEKTTSNITKMILTPKTKNLETIFSKNHVLIGIKLAQALGVHINDSIELLLPSEEQLQKNALHFSTNTIKIGGIFKTGIEEFDTNVLISSFSAMNSILPDLGVTSIHVAHSKNCNTAELVKKIHARFGFQTYTWQDLYPALIAALALEKYAMIFIMGFMMLLASISIIALLFMIITSKQKDIAILHAMGLSQKYCNAIFVIIGIIISTIASTIGLSLATLTGLILKKYNLITLPDAYYVSHLPIIMQGEMIAGIFFFILLITLCATSIPFLSNKKISLSYWLKS